MDAKEATRIAASYFTDLTGIKHVTLEEVELIGTIWEVTLGYFEEKPGVIYFQPQQTKE